MRTLTWSQQPPKIYQNALKFVRIILDIFHECPKFPRSFRTQHSNFSSHFGLTKPYDSTVEARHKPEVSALVARELIHWAKAEEVQARKRIFRAKSLCGWGRYQWYLLDSINPSTKIVWTGDTVSGLFRWFISIIVYSYIIIVGYMYIDCLFALVSASAYLPFFASFCLYTQGNYVNTHTQKHNIQ